MATVTPPDPLPPDRNVGPVLLGVSSTLIAFVIITTCLRIWVRFSMRNLGWDDYSIVVVTGLGIARYAVQVAQVKIGNGRHRWYISKENYINNNMLGWVAQILLFSSICLLKVSILLLLLRIKDAKWTRYTSWAIMAGLVLTNFGAVVILLAECDPVDAYWTGVGTCWDARIRIYWIYMTIGYSILTDILCSLLPLLAIWKVRIPFTTKLSVWALMSLGLVATGFGIARAASLGIVTSDLSWVYAITAIWSNLELYLGIIGANLALGRSMFLYFFRGGQSNNNSSYIVSGSNAAYINSGYRDDSTNNTQTFVRSNRPPSPSQSDNSDIPLEPGIQKRTDIWVGEEIIGQESRMKGS
ncbi:hypothetical protein EDB81DRAFT_932142 [Dactylonectria macrodidyma]|uniref:Rhodopsin domain-containing protein n=1 Tax=Dactylonectria macrodidyma TaxID=307937 RepID=A0A9P9F342_9HYPO|nr:hypothetical protein EDB81DRAFT_932142 [Dactylonectria macrodidyma]